LPIEIWDKPVPPPSPGEVLARVELSGVCGTDVHFWRGEVPMPGPVVLGHEGVAVVEDLGRGVTTDFAGVPIARGDRIYWQPIRACHRCYACTILKDFSMCETGFAPILRNAAEPTAASYSEYSLLPDGMAFYRVPDDTPSSAVIAFGCAMPTILQGAERIGGIALGNDVVVQGCGPVGLAGTIVAHLSGARRLIVTGAPAKRLEMARRLGATDTIDMDAIKSADDRVERVRELTDGRGADVVIEAAGAIPAFPEGLRMVAKGGRYLIIGLWSAPGTVPVEPRFLNNNNLRIVGNALAQPSHIYGAMHLARKYHREFALTDVITHRFALDASQQALEAVARLETVKAVIVP
jgi:5-exo-hydroxycamphor dehydrogenase